MNTCDTSPSANDSYIVSCGNRRKRKSNTLACILPSLKMILLSQAFPKVCHVDGIRNKRVINNLCDQSCLNWNGTSHHCELKAWAFLCSAVSPSKPSIKIFCPWTSLANYTLTYENVLNQLNQNRPHLLYQYSNIAPRLSGQNCNFFKFRFSLNSRIQGKQLPV